MVPVGLLRFFIEINIEGQQRVALLTSIGKDAGIIVHLP